MRKTRSRRLWPSTTLAVAMLVGCGDTGGCGGSGDDPYEYPYGAEGAEVTEQVLRARITQGGFDTIAGSLAGLIEASCAGNPADATETCAIDPDDPNRVRFYLGTVAEPMSNFKVGSHLSIELDSLANLKVTAIPSSSGSGYLDVTAGCAGTACSSEDAIRMWVDVTYESDNIVCSVEDRAPLVSGDSPVPGLILQELTFELHLSVQPDASGRPTLTLADEDIVVRNFSPEIWLDVDHVDTDPACDSSTCEVACTLADFTQSIGSGVLAFVDDIGPWFAEMLVDSLTGDFTDQPMQIAGLLDLQTLIPVSSAYTEGTGYVVAANMNTPSVTGDPGRAGFNLDFDAGFVGEHSPCVPDILQPDWDLPEAPDPGQSVMAPNPDTGALELEGFDLAVLIGDSFVRRAAYALFDTGGLCFDASARAVEELTAGAFVPTVALFDLLAPGLTSLAGSGAPVDLQVTPRLPPTLVYGSGEGSGETRDSHIKVIWPELWIEIYPLIDDAATRVITFSTDLYVGISLDPSPTGNIAVSIDRLELENLSTIYNEINLRFDAAAVGQLVADLLLPVLLTGDPIDVELTSDLIGLPFVPKVRALQRLGAERYLTMFLRFCDADAVADESDSLCYEDPNAEGAGNGPVMTTLNAWRVGGDRAAPRDAVRVAARSPLGSAERLQLGYRVDNSGPWFGFRGAQDDGSFILRHPRLARPGRHQISIRARHRDRPGLWSEVYTMPVTLDRIAPTVSATRYDKELEIHAWDDRSPSDLLLIRAEIAGPAGQRSVDWAPRRSIAVATEERATLWAMDEAGMVSEPFAIAPAAVEVQQTESADTGGCAAAASPLSAAPWALAVLLMMRRRRMARQCPANR